MSYFPIKCPYCLEEIKNEDVRYLVDEAVALAAGAGRGMMETIAPDAGQYVAAAGVLVDEDEGDGFADAVDYSEDDGEEQGHPSEKDDDYSPITDVMPHPDASSEVWMNVSAQVRQQAKERYKLLPLTIKQIQNIWGEDNVVLLKTSVAVPPKLFRAGYEGELVIGIQVRESANDSWRVSNTRYCPHCKDVKLHGNSGRFPSYVALLIGTSDAGKTVYLTSLYQSLSTGGGFRLPYNGSFSISIDGSGGSEISEFASKLFNENDGSLPHTTTNLITEPLILNISISFEQSNVKALLFLRDIPGETFRDNNTGLSSLILQFSKFDSYLLLLDPYTFPSAGAIWHRQAQSNEKSDLMRFQSAISHTVSQGFKSKITIPTTVLITKGDMFFAPEAKAALSAKGVKPSNPALAQPLTYFDKNYFSSVHEGSKQILSVLNPSILSFVDGWFEGPYYAVVSALGRNVRVIEAGEPSERIRKVDNPNLITPWKIAETMAKLLMPLHVMPPFELVEAKPAYEEEEMDRAERLAYNRRIINLWGEAYCANWTTIG